MSRSQTATTSPRERLVRHVQELERLQAIKDLASADVSEALAAAKADGFDPATLRVVLKLRRMTSSQRRERRALESIYLAALGMLEGEPLPDEARRRLDGAGAPPSDQAPTPPAPDAPAPAEARSPVAPARPPAQPPLIVKDPAEAKQEGADAAAAGKRIYDNPYPAGDPCRAAWDEGWCGRNKSHGMETPQAYQRRTDPPPKPEDRRDADADRGDQRGAA